MRETMRDMTVTGSSRTLRTGRFRWLYRVQVFADRGARQPEVIAHRRAGIGLAVEAAPLQLRNNLVDEFVERARKIRRHHAEPVRRAFQKPLLERVRDGPRRAAQHPVAARRGGQVVEVAERHVLALAFGQQGASETMRRVGERQIRNRPVERVFRDIGAQPRRQHCEAFRGVDVALQRVEHVARLRVGPADDRHNTRQDRHAAGIAAEAANALLEAGIGGFRLLEVLHHRKHDIGGAGRQRLAALGAAGLEHQRLTLRTAAHVEGPLHGKARPLVVERADLALVKELAGLEVGNDGVVAPAIPQTAHHIDEFFRDLVAVLVVRMRAAEIAAGGGRRGGDRVPGRPAAADVIQRCEDARDGVGIAVGRRHGRGETDMRRRHRQRREQRQRLQAAGVGRVVAQIGGEAVAQKQEVEQPPFGDGGHALLHSDVEEGLVGAGKAPAGGVIAGAEQKDAKVDGPRHDCTFSGDRTW